MTARAGSRVQTSSAASRALADKGAGRDGLLLAGRALPLEYVYRHSDPAPLTRAAANFCDLLLLIAQRGAQPERIREKMQLVFPGRPSRHRVGQAAAPGALAAIDRAAELYDAVLDSNASIREPAARFRQAVCEGLAATAGGETVADRAVHLLAALHASATD